MTNLNFILLLVIFSSTAVFSQKSIMEITYSNDSVILAKRDNVENYSPIRSSEEIVYTRAFDVDNMPIYKDCENTFSRQARAVCMQNGIFRSVFNNIQYPKEAILNEEEGSVILHYIVEKDGSLLPTSLVYHSEALKSATIGGIKKWLQEIKGSKFAPALIDNNPVPYADFMVFTYKLDLDKTAFMESDETLVIGADTDLKFIKDKKMVNKIISIKDVKK